MHIPPPLIHSRILLPLSLFLLLTLNARKCREREKEIGIEPHLAHLTSALILPSCFSRHYLSRSRVFFIRQEEEVYDDEGRQGAAAGQEGQVLLGSNISGVASIVKFAHGKNYKSAKKTDGFLYLDI